MQTNQNHTPHRDYDMIATGFPVVDGYPVPQPPPPNTAAPPLPPSNPAARTPPPPNTAARSTPPNTPARSTPPNTAARPTPPNTAAARPRPRNTAARPPEAAAAAAGIESTGTPAPRWVSYVMILLPLTYLTFLCVAFSYAIENPPRFGVEWASVSLAGNSSGGGATKATWDIGFSVKNTNSHKPHKYKEFNVWVMCAAAAAGYWSEIVVPPFQQRPKNTTFITARVNTTLPLHDSRQRVMLDFQAKLWVRDAKNKTVLATCGDMKVVLPTNATNAIMVGGPRFCSSQDGRIDDL